ncbi:Rho guanine nucleotide exchange factor 8 [Frankliniella fusca]|uniref:Rho guanine nucleotide exchange factor 8 n=1 Tax=Frankliniella fusca TaxID=407009 RepID=A0AAE1LAS3_9NEOP|nr:Rho guanine nucleotide exchange factor 8 [Frankliniella fusca]
MPPQTAKLPAITGDRCCIADKLPAKRLEIPLGALRKPRKLWKTPPPMAPIANAPPISSIIRHGHGSRVYSSICKEWIDLQKLGLKDRKTKHRRLCDKLKAKTCSWKIAVHVMPSSN